MNQSLSASATLTNAKLQFRGVAGANPPVQLDYTPPLGDGQGYTPLELVLVSLAGCAGSTVASLLRKMQKTVAGIEVHAAGLRREVHPTSFERISLEFVLKSDDASAADIERAIQLSEDKYCPVWAMLKGNVQVTWTCRLVPSGG